jgi:hypothetical protein
MPVEERTAEQIAAQAAIDEQNNRAILRGNILRLLPTSAVKPKQDATPEEILRAIEALPEMKLHRSGGNLVGETADGKKLSFIQVIERALLASPALADGRSTRHVELSAEQFKSEMTPTQKSAFISAHGYDAWVKLPERRIAAFSRDARVITKSQFLSLPVSERAKYTEDEIAQILRRTG